MRLSRIRERFVTLSSVRPMLESAAWPSTCWPSKPIGQSSDPYWRTTDTVGTAWRISSGVEGDSSGMPFGGANRQTRRRRWPCGLGIGENGPGLKASSVPSPTSRFPRRPVPGGGNAGSVGVGSYDEGCCEATGLHGRISNQPGPWAAANRAEKPISVNTHVLNHSTTRSM